jgi:hypothetical protein
VSTPLSHNKDKTAKVMDALANLDDTVSDFVSVQNGIQNHTEKFYLKPEESSYAMMAEIASKAAAEERETAAITREFRYRPWDGANAVANVLSKLFGYPGFGKGIEMPFGGKIPPQRINVNVGVDETIEVPWGQLEVPDMEAVFHLGAQRDPELGLLFMLTIELPKKFEKQARAIGGLVEAYLKDFSIYKGQAITGGETPEFIDLSQVNRANFVYKREVDTALEAEIWNPLRYPALYEKDGQPLRWISLLAGGYGTGKTSAAQLTAQVAVENGWTFIQARPNKDNLQEVMSLAHIYAPAVVFYEDVDVVANTPDQGVISSLLEAFDGMRSKGHPVSVMMTTNHPENIHPGLIRAGRLHTYLVFGDLDQEALTHLIQVKVGKSQLQDDIDYSVVYENCKHYSPSFMALVIDLAKRYAFFDWTAVLRNEYIAGNPGATSQQISAFVNDRIEKESAADFSYQLSTENLVDAALRLREQWQLTSDNAGNIPAALTLDNVFKTYIREEAASVIQHSGVNDEGFWVNTDALEEDSATA